MATKDQVLELHRKQPSWDDLMIAEHLDCTPEYVRATMHRNSRKLPPRHPRAEPGQRFVGPDNNWLVAVPVTAP